VATNVLGDAIKAALDGLVDKTDRVEAMRAMGNEIEDWVSGTGSFETEIVIHKTGDPSEGVKLTYNATDESLDISFFS
jgi:hypothetical protein